MNLETSLASVIIVISFFNLLRMAMYLIGSDIYTMKNLHEKKQAKTRFTPYVTVIVPAYNEASNVTACLDSIVASRYPASRLTIVVANDGSTDNTKDVVRQYIRNYKGRVTIRLMNQKNKGKAAALNAAIKKHATSAYVMCLDADSFLHEDAIYNGAQQFRDKRVAAVAANVQIIETGTLLNMIQRFEYLVSYQMKKAQVLYNVEYITGGIGSMFRRRFMKEVGYYDTNTMTEDIDLSMKLIKQGNKEYRLAYAADSIAYTESVHSLKGLIRQRFRWKYGRMQTFLKHRSMFFSADRKYSKQLTFFMLPFAIMQEFLFMIEPFIAGYIFYTILRYADFPTFTMAFAVIMIYLSLNLWASNNLTFWQKARLSYYAPPMYFLLYLLSFVEYAALAQSVVKLPNLKKSIAKNNVTWTPPERAGV